MFKLIQLSVSLFAIVKADEETFGMPIIAHGFINVTDCIAQKYTAILLNNQMPRELTESNESGVQKYTAILLNNQMSKELTESNELEVLKRKAIELTEEAVDDEFGD